MSQFNIISATSESTVVAEYTPDACRSDSYQSEAALEQEFLRLLCAQGYEYLEIHDEAVLVAMREQTLEELARECAEKFMTFGVTPTQAAQLLLGLETKKEE